MDKERRNEATGRNMVARTEIRVGPNDASGHIVNRCILVLDVVVVRALLANPGCSCRFGPSRATALQRRVRGRLKFVRDDGVALLPLRLRLPNDRLKA